MSLPADIRMLTPAVANELVYNGEGIQYLIYKYRRDFGTSYRAPEAWAKLKGINPTVLNTLILAGLISSDVLLILEETYPIEYDEFLDNLPFIAPYEVGMYGISAYPNAIEDGSNPNYAYMDIVNSLPNSFERLRTEHLYPIVYYRSDFDNRDEFVDILKRKYPDKHIHRDIDVDVILVKGKFFSAGTYVNLINSRYIVN